MIKVVWTQFISLVCIILFSSGVATNAFLSDIEVSENNMFVATLLDSELSGDPIAGHFCYTSETISTDMRVTNSGVLPFTYELLVDDMAGALCNEVTASVTSATESYYHGPLSDLLVEGIVLPSSSATDLTLSTSLSGSSNTDGLCVFTTVLNAMQTTATTAQGFSDTERTTHMIERDSAQCGPTVNLYLNKHISGDNQGFELSDFSYHVIGEGIDVVAPHDSFTPLPAGTYTIEELVPEGFVKDDWRIGWYGQCESGSAFSTTITVEDRHLTWGTLYCEADNQYRPEDNEATATDDDPVTESVSSSRAGERNRDTRTSRAGEATVAGVSTTTTTITDSNSSTTDETDETTGVSTAEEESEDNELDVSSPDKTVPLGSTAIAENVDEVPTEVKVSEEEVVDTAPEELDVIEPGDVEEEDEVEENEIADNNSAELDGDEVIDVVES